MVGADPENSWRTFGASLPSIIARIFVGDRKKNFFFFVCDGVAFRFRFRNDFSSFPLSKARGEERTPLGKNSPIKWAWTAALVYDSLSVAVVVFVFVAAVAVVVAVDAD